MASPYILGLNPGICETKLGVLIARPWGPITLTHSHSAAGDLAVLQTAFLLDFNF